MVVVGDDLDLAAVDPALGIDLVGRELRGLRDLGAGDGLGFGDHAYLDGIRGERRAGSKSESGRHYNSA